jgi:hypothetical protein
MIEFRDVLRAERGAREAYSADERRITAGICGSLAYTYARTQLIQRLLGQLSSPGRSRPFGLRLKEACRGRGRSWFQVRV